MNHWATILDIAQAGMEGDATRCRAYVELWMQRLIESGDTVMAMKVQRLLAGERGNGVTVKSEGQQCQL